MQILHLPYFVQRTTMILFIFLALSISACHTKQEPNIEQEKIEQEKNQKLFTATMQKHLDAVSNKNLSNLKSTMSPEGKMQLILPGSEIINGVDGFMNYHKEWFQDTTSNWTFETKILQTEVGKNIGIAITEIVYKEPERNGEPYFNRMIVSYALEKIGEQWYIIKDHASSIEKSTD